MNLAILIGNLGKDPDIKVMQSGDRVCHLSVATSESWKDKSSGEKKERTQWHRVVIFSQGLIKVAEKHLKKGCKVMIQGQVETHKWADKEGNDQYSTEIVLRSNGKMEILTWADDTGGGRTTSDDDGDTYTQNDHDAEAAAAAKNKRKYGTALEEEDFSDIPF